MSSFFCPEDFGAVDTAVALDGGAGGEFVIRDPDVVVLDGLEVVEK
jgi:hypothetical protein